MRWGVLLILIITLRESFGATGDPCSIDPDCSTFCTFACTCSSMVCTGCIVQNTGQSCTSPLGNSSFCDPDGTCPEPTPTLSPSSSPTTSPTSSPTLGPSSSPTLGPSSSPTLSPTLGPSSSPTPSPTGSPSPSPSASPTQIPSPSPTSSRTSGPSASPTFSPSLSPSSSPSSAPTRNPTFSPTESPTSPVSYVVTQNVTIQGDVVIGSLNITSGSRVSVNGTAFIGGPLVVNLESKPPSGSSVYMEIITASDIQGNFSNLVGQSSDLDESCERLDVVEDSSTSFSTFSVVVSTVSDCGLPIGAIAGIILGCVVLVVGLGLLFWWLSKKKKQRWTQAKNAEIARKRAESMKKHYSKDKS